MFLFDNILFNSFIPQVFMVLMFLYCSFSMFMTNVLEVQDNNLINCKDAVVYEQSSFSVEPSSSLDKVVNFFDSSNFQPDGMLEEYNIPITVPVIAVLHTEKDLDGEDTCHQNFSFSRPPPVFI